MADVLSLIIEQLGEIAQAKLDKNELDLTRNFGQNLIVKKQLYKKSFVLMSILLNNTFFIEEITDKLADKVMYRKEASWCGESSEKKSNIYFYNQPKKKFRYRN